MWWIGPIVLIGLRLLSAEASLSRAQTKGSTLVFRGGQTLRLLIGGLIVGFSAFILSRAGKEESWPLVILAIFVILACFAWPATITVSERGLECHVWWRKAVVLPWNEVSGIQKSASGYIQVFCTRGKSITFTPQHVDPHRFQDEVMRRAGLKSIIDASAPPTLRL